MALAVAAMAPGSGAIVVAIALSVVAHPAFWLTLAAGIMFLVGLGYLVWRK